MIKINIGCGDIRPENWVNTDKSFKIVISELKGIRYLFPSSKKSNATYLNIGKKWKFDSGSVDILYASHVFEHLDKVDRAHFIAEASRVVKPGGILRIVVPDLYTLCRQYVDGYETGNKDAANRLLYWMNMHKDNLHGRELPLYKKLYNFVQNYPKQHQIMLDKHTLAEYLSPTLWTNLEFTEYAKSVHMQDAISEVEFDAQYTDSIYLEAIRGQ